MPIRDRILELRRVCAADLRPHPRNWRTHPTAQHDALRGLLAEVGYASALLARELNDGTLELIDGHLRAELTPDAVVPVLVLDVDHREAEKLLATLDPVANLATASPVQLQSLLAEIDTENAAIQQMLDTLPTQYAAAEPAEPPPCQRPAVPVPECYEVVVECRDEVDQQTVFERMRSEGYKCRVLTL